MERHFRDVGTPRWRPRRITPRCRRTDTSLAMLGRLLAAERLSCLFDGPWTMAKHPARAALEDALREVVLS